MRIFKLFTIIILLTSSLSDIHALRPVKNKKVQDDTLALSCLGVAERFSDVHDGIDSRLDFYKSKGYTHYFYTPTDDRYSNAWGWKFLYNDSDRKMLRELREKCHQKGLDFVWTVNPGDGWSDADYEFLKNKLLMMYYNGIKSFAVRFSSDSVDFKAVEDSLKADFAVALPKAQIQIWILNQLPVVLYPSDEDVALSLMKGYHFDKNFLSYATSADALVCMLTEKGELAKTALVAMSECARNPMGYLADAAMEKAIMTLSPEVKTPLMTFLEHTGGVKESESVTTFSVGEWTPEKSAALMAEFEKIERVPSEMAACSSPVLMESLSPWLKEFGKLGARGIRTLRAMQHYNEKNLGAFWLAYIDNMQTEEDRLSYLQYPVGEKKLYPFCINIMRELTELFSSVITGGVISVKPDFTKSVSSNGHIEFEIPADANTCRLLTGPLQDGRLYLFRQLANDGSLVAEHILSSPYSEFDLKEDAVKVDVSGDIDIYETIFVYL